MLIKCDEMISCEKINNRADLEKAFAIRIKVFVEEQGVVLSDEIDSYEDESEHVLAYYDGKPCGVGRLREIDGKGKLERICVLKEYRKYGIGQVIVCTLERLAVQRGLLHLKLHGQKQAAGFYMRLGYKAEGGEFIEDGIVHFLFLKELCYE